MFCLRLLFFLPMIAIAVIYSGSEMIMQAAIITLFMFSGLTAVVFMTKPISLFKNCNYHWWFCCFRSYCCRCNFGFNLGLWFSVGMVVLASASILYQTSQIKDQFSTDQYVGASLQLFASIMLLFWYVLRILMSRK